jgi:hypothetical protein
MHYFLFITREIYQVTDILTLTRYIQISFDERFFVTLSNACKYFRWSKLMISVAPCVRLTMLATILTIFWLSSDSDSIDAHYRP